MNSPVLTRAAITGEVTAMAPGRTLPPVPPDLWDRPEMAEALANRELGAILRIYRTELGTASRTP